MPTPFDDVTIDPRLATTGGVFPALASSRFGTGAIVAGRYRLVALLGKGGMGEVYRADDLTLDQPVALKFLPEGIAVNDARLAQFHNELRVARQVSHKNVCRLYDLGEAGGRRFLTMEYVDGEDLSSSLRRFGRMPPDKAVQIARQLCAGVAAAHEKDVIHRDLKPANVMLDGNGDVRITDFGIATAAADAGADIAGTPQYMAPELLAGKPASVKSDIYALGLILFEIFTGKRARDAKTIGELRALDDTGTVTTPSSIVRDLDPAVERVILRCLEKDPERRPASALTVAASLPGGDPLAAALASGETPSPEMLIAAAESQAMPVALALPLAIALVAVFLATPFIVSRASLAGLVPLTIPRDVLAYRAEDTIKRLGYSTDFADRAMGFSSAGPYLPWLEKNGPRDWWNELRAGRPPGLLFWFRTSPEEMIPTSQAGRVSADNPPTILPGMHEVFLDTEGRLIQFHSVPPQVESEPAASAPPWPTMFELAGLDPKSFTSSTPQWTPPLFADSTAAWDGSLPGRPDIHVRVEAAALRNRLVSFELVWPWTEPARGSASAKTAMQKIADGVSLAVWLLMIGGGLVLAVHNVRTHRADRRGAARFAIAITALTFIVRMWWMTHLTNPRAEFYQQVMGCLNIAAGLGGMMWIYYLAIEPYARRVWPDALLGWSRLVSGHLRDSRVGREILIGLALGSMSQLLLDAIVFLPKVLGQKLVPIQFGWAFAPLASTSLVFYQWLNMLVNSLGDALAIALLLLIPRVFFSKFFMRRPVLSMLTGFVVLLALMNGGSVLTGTWMTIINNVVFTAVLVVATYRFGLLATAAALIGSNILHEFPVTSDFSAWWAMPTTLTLIMLIGATAFAYYAARAGEPLFGKLISE